MLKNAYFIVLLIAATVIDAQNENIYNSLKSKEIGQGHETLPIMYRRKRDAQSQDDNSDTTATNTTETDVTHPTHEDEENVGDDEVEESIPMPEKFIGSRRKHPQDTLREQMIGMIFTGEPQPLGYRPRPEVTRRRFRSRPKFPPEHGPDFRIRERPKEILKPMPFVPRQSNVEFPMPILQPSGSRPLPHFVRGPPPKSHINFRPNIRQSPRPERRPDSRPPKPFHPFPGKNNFPLSKDTFSNNVGPDFGPVTFEDFGTNFESTFNDFDSPYPSKKPHKPFPPPFRKPGFELPESSYGFANTKFGGFDEIPKFGGFPTDKGPDGCHKYTEDICLDTDNYPHEEILTSLAKDPTRARILMAEVRDQSADDLVDGITAAQEAKYDYTHYFGNRRQDGAHRDFAEEGGYLCPSEVKYARPKRARNSKGEWKFIVNMEKYSQTIRMEKCMKPGGSCSYVSHHYRATCNQIYNYQRLLSWEKKRGLHMDIFKVPSCCTCHIQGYAYVFPPLNEHDMAFSGSQRTDKYHSFEPRNLEDIHREAPPYSPVNFPNLPASPDDRISAEEDVKPGRRINPRQRMTTRRRTRHHSGNSVNRTNNPLHRVNYDYHPIIDFFKESSVEK